MEQHYKVYNYYDLEEYRKWVRNHTKKMIYEFLFFGIIRESEDVKKWSHPAHYTYKKYFKNGLLASRYSQERIAEYLELDRTYVSRCLNVMEKQGFIKIVKEKRDIGIINYYILGECSEKFNTAKYRETYYLDEYFKKLRRDQEDEMKAEAEKIREEAGARILERLRTEHNVVEEEIERIRRSWK